MRPPTIPVPMKKCNVERIKHSPWVKRQRCERQRPISTEIDSSSIRSIKPGTKHLVEPIEGRPDRPSPFVHLAEDRVLDGRKVEGRAGQDDSTMDISNRLPGAIPDKVDSRAGTPPRAPWLLQASDSPSGSLDRAHRGPHYDRQGRNARR